MRARETRRYRAWQKCSRSVAPFQAIATRGGVGGADDRGDAGAAPARRALRAALARVSCRRARLCSPSHPERLRPFESRCRAELRCQFATCSVHWAGPDRSILDWIWASRTGRQKRWTCRVRVATPTSSPADPTWRRRDSPGWPGETSHNGADRWCAECSRGPEGLTTRMTRRVGSCCR